MSIEIRIKKNFFQDALRLMRISKTMREIEGVKNAVAVMATEKAKFAIEDAGLMNENIKKASGGDLVIIVNAESKKLARNTIKKIESLVSTDITEANQAPPDLLDSELKVINIGLDIFRDSMEAQGVTVRHVDWQVPADGDMKLINILKKLM